MRIENQAEPLPGYRLIERIGGGGFGEVWKAEAPGGLFKAIKFVFGDLQSIGEDAGRAEQELKALSRVKSVHHPYILSLERFDIIDGQLMIVMELADQTLGDRFRECQVQGLVGIPRAELLKYMREAAEALDLMNIEYHLQHLDIKPQNIFLVHNHIKVADFGLVKDLEGMSASVTGGVTPVYAAPETFDGWVSRFCDQYSLAIVYQELLTGVRPFRGKTINHLVMQHLQAIPDLSSMPQADREPMMRALAKNPDERFPTCSEFVEQLIASGPQQTTASPLFDPDPSLDEEDAVPLANTISPALDLTGDEFDSHLKTEKVSKKSSSFIKLPKVTLDKTPSPIPKDATPDDDELMQTRPSDPGLGNGVLRPTLVVGVGGQGLDVIRKFRHRIVEQFGSVKALSVVRMMYIDTDAASIKDAQRGSSDEGLLPSETYWTRLYRPSHYLRGHGQQKPLGNWLETKLLYQIPREQSHARLRALGRLGFVDHSDSLIQKLADEAAACCDVDALDETATRLRLGEWTETPRVYVVCGLSGGTGSGMFLDVAYSLRRLLAAQGHPDAEIVGLFILPDANSSKSEQANTVAALTELHHFSMPEHPFFAHYKLDADHTCKPCVEDDAPPFHRCVFVHMAKKSSQDERNVNPNLAMAGHYLFYDALSSLGRITHELRTVTSGDGLRMIFQHIGLYRHYWPRQRLLHRISRRLCQRLLGQWMDKDGKPFSESMQDWALSKWEEKGLRPENLIELHKEKCVAATKRPLDSFYRDVLQPVEQAFANEKPQVMDATLVIKAMSEFEKIFGIPEAIQNDKSEDVADGTIQTMIAKVSEQIAERAEQIIAGAVVRKVEDPNFRLAGAEEAVRQLSALIEQALQAQEPLARELEERTVKLYRRIHKMLDGPVEEESSGLSFFHAFRRNRKSEDSTPNEILEMLRWYPKLRLQHLILQHVIHMYVRLRGLLSDQIREIGFCRHRLKELTDLILNLPEPIASDGARETCLLPSGLRKIEEAAAQFDERILPADLLDFDVQVQQIVKKQYQALVRICLESSNFVRSFSSVLFTQAEAFLQAWLEGANVVEMFLTTPEENPSQWQPAEQLQKAYAEAVPETGQRAGLTEISLITVPRCPGAQRFRELAEETIPNARLIGSNFHDEILIYREFVHRTLSEDGVMPVEAREVYRQRFAVDPSAIHSRLDILDPSACNDEQD